MSSLSSVFNLSPRRVFSLTGGQLAVYHWRSGVLSDPHRFPADEAGLRAFNHYLASAPGMTSYLLVDLVEEEFRQETIPHVFGSDRRALLRNRQTRLFRDARFTHSMVQGREAEGRRDDICLFTALIRPELLAPWMSPIMKYKVPLAGIYSVPMLSTALLPKLPVSNRDVLLVTLQASGGLRQTFMSGGQLKISRLAVAPQLDPAQHASYVLTEVEKLRRYLHSLRMLEVGAALEVVLLTGGSLGHDLRNQAASTPEVTFHVLEVGDVAKSIKLKSHLAGAFADGLFAHLLARETPGNHYARSEDLRYMRHNKARSAMGAASVLALLGSIAYSGFQFIESVMMQRDSASLSAQAVFYEERYQIGKQGLTESYRKAGLGEVVAQPRELKQAVDMVATLRQYKADPLPLLVALSQGLASFEKIQIQKIDWGTSLNPQADVGDSGGIRARANDFRNPVLALGAPLEKGAYFQLSRINGRVEPFDGDYRDALDRVNRFAAALNELDGVEDVRLTRLPFDASSRRRLSGSATQDGRQQEALFELRLVIKVGGQTVESQ
jgi:hypothetical protein